MYPIFEIPLQFIDQYLNRRWIIILVIILIIYFNYLRQKYYNRDTFSNKKKNNITKTTKSKKIETFTDNIQNTNSNIISSSISNIEVSNNLFINLNLPDNQMSSVLDNYKNVIKITINNLINLSKQKDTNPYLRVDKSFRKIITDGVDNIINYITNVLKSQYSLTRTDIKTDFLLTIKRNIENQSDKINTDLMNEMNIIATMNSTTVDYNKQLNKINELRSQLDTMIKIDQLITDFSNNDSNYSKQVNQYLNKSYVLPIYEKNIDRINQILNSDYNGNEERLADKYGKMYTQYLEEEKKKELDINPLQLGSQIESGLVDLLTNLFSNKPKDILPKINDKITSNNLVEQYGSVNNYISRPNKNIIPPQQEPIPNNIGELDKSNIFIDPSNRGSYLINQQARNNLIENFENKNDTKKESVIFGFANYIIDTIKNTLGPSYTTLQSKFNNTYNLKELGNNIKLEDNLIPAGFILFILSMLLYFVDLTS